MKITKAEAIEIVSKHSVFNTLSDHVLNDKKTQAKAIEKEPYLGTIIIMK